MESFRQRSDQSSLRRQCLCRRFHYEWHQWLQREWMAMGREYLCRSSSTLSDSQYGMFVILLPLAISPALIVLLVGDRRAKRLGALSLASSSYARRQYLTSQVSERENRTFLQSCLHYWSRLNGFGFLLMGFAFVLLLAPMTLNTTAKGGYTNREYDERSTVG